MIECVHDGAGLHRKAAAEIECQRGVVLLDHGLQGRTDLLEELRHINDLVRDKIRAMLLHQLLRMNP